MLKLIAEVRVPIELNGDSYTMCFDANAMAAYEDATGEFYLDALAKLYDALKPALAPTVEDSESAALTRSFEVVRKVPIKCLRALLWAAIHEYDKDDNPHWPLTLNQVGRLLQVSDVTRVFLAFLRGQTKNYPTKEEMGESLAVVKEAPDTARTPTVGGAPIIVLPEGVLT